MRRTRTIPYAIVAGLLSALAIAIFLRAKAPPEAARLLPESDAIVYLQLKTLRTATHFDQSPIARSPDFQRFIDATGIVPERDLDAVAFALHRMPDPRGPNGPVAYSEVFVGRFDALKLRGYLSTIATSTERYADHDIFSIPIEGRTLRVAQLGYDTLAASNMPTAEQIHSMLDRSRTSALSTPGSSLLAARFHEVPLLSQAWGIGHIGLPFSQNGRIALFGLELPLPEDTDLVASLRFSGAVHLRIEEIAPDTNDAHNTVDAMNTLLSIARGLGNAEPKPDPAAAAMRSILDETKIEQHNDRALLTASATIEQMKALATAHNPIAADLPTLPNSDPTPATPRRSTSVQPLEAEPRGPMRQPLSAVVFALSCCALTSSSPAQTLTGQQSFTDYTTEAPGVRRHVTLADLPKPMPDTSASNGAHVVPRPEGAWPKAPAGFKVTVYANTDFKQPRLIRTAPNGDLFLADSEAGTVIVLRGMGADGKAAERHIFATDLDHPFGIAFYPAANPKWVYVANTTSLVRFPYRGGAIEGGKPEVVVPTLPGYARLTGGGHWTRDVVFSADGKRMFVSVGSASNVDDTDTHPGEFHRADVLEYTPEGKFVKIYASGIRNCVGEAINPITGALWCSTNERDGLGDNLVPDYISSVPEDSFFGWPWWYMGGQQDPRHPGKHPELQSKVRTPDVILQPHFASLEMTFYPQVACDASCPATFPSKYSGDAFAAEHGSWNRASRTGYEVIRVPMKNGIATGEYEDFLTGFVTPDGQVWGRPVGVTIGNDGSMFVVDDGSRTVWHVTYTGPTNSKVAAIEPRP